MKKKIYMILVLMVSTFCLTACGGSGTESLNQSKEDQAESSIDVDAMDTYMTLRAYGENRDDALDAAKTEIERLDDMWSVGNEKSEVSVLNKEKQITASNETVELIECAQKISEETDGAFDITIYPLMDLWGFTTQKYHVPKDAEIVKILKKHIGMDKVIVEKESNTVTLLDGAQIDLGGIAKGFASQSVAQIFEEYQISHGIISLGGNVQAIGKKPDGSRWKVGIESPNDHFDMVGTYEAKDEAVITSGGYERYFEEDGKTYHHILDPKTGKPADSDLVSVTIVSKAGMKADCLSTTLFVLGKDKSINYWKEHKDEFDFILVDQEDNIYVSEGIEDHFSSDYDFKIIRK
ncbi:MAG: FAD:protein FMN transferase [Lachnospiraceae bacterium]|nr:FAD:protein FMN transferase [Lachnospiraceae bacterium]